MKKKVESLTGPSRVVSEGVLLAMASAFAYAMAYFYESQYARAFGIPLQLISLDITTMLVAATAFVGFAYFAFATVDLAWKLGGKAAPDNVTAVRFVLVVFAAVLLLLLAYGANLKQILITLSTIAVPFALGLWLGIFKAKKVDTENAERTAKDLPLFSFMLDAIGPKWALLFAFGVFGLFLSGGLGLRAASKQHEFFVLEDVSNQVVLRIYGDTVISAPFDPCTKQILRPITVQRLSDITALRMREVELGPLGLNRTSEQIIDGWIGIQHAAP